jgi:hypothetical protein
MTSTEAIQGALDGLWDHSNKGLPALARLFEQYLRGEGYAIVAVPSPAKVSVQRSDDSTLLVTIAGLNLHQVRDALELIGRMHPDTES